MRIITDGHHMCENNNRDAQENYNRDSGERELSLRDACNRNIVEGQYVSESYH